MFMSVPGFYPLHRHYFDTISKRRVIDETKITLDFGPVHGNFSGMTPEQP